MGGNTIPLNQTQGRKRGGKSKSGDYKKRERGPKNEINSITLTIMFLGPYRMGRGGKKRGVVPEGGEKGCGQCSILYLTQIL